MNLRTILSLSPDKAGPILLGSIISVSTEGGEVTAGKIVEVEAYFSIDDPASHHARGQTSANASMFKDAGTLYVHRQRHHTLMDIVTKEDKYPGALLIRAIEPVEGIESMKERRGTDNVYSLCSGPAKLCQALGISMDDDGINIFDTESRVKILLPEKTLPSEKINVGVRVGISKNRTALLRFWVKDSYFVSK